jgi:uncharacterized coiled-coil DUF342 family protein
MSVESDKKKREVIALDTKLDIIKPFDNGQSKASISRVLGKEILIKELEQTFRNLEAVKQQTMDLDPNVERSMLVRRTIENGISCYRKMYEEKTKATSVQTTLNKYFSSSISIFHSFIAHFFSKRFLAYLIFVILYISIYLHS